MKDAKAIVRNYRIIIIILTVFSIGIIVFLNFLKLDFYIHILSVLGVFVIYRIIGLSISFKQIHSILLLKFDAPQYKEVIFQKGLRPHIAFQLDSAAYNGEYQTVINLCSKVINGKFKSNFKLSVFACMARAYYEMGDMKNLEHTCNLFDDFLTGYNKKINPKIKLIMQYYRLFVLEDYKTCFSILEELNDLRKDNSRNGKISKIFATYNYGVLYYKTGDFDNAIIHFNNVIEVAPKLQNAKLSQKHIDAINNSVEYVSEYDEVLPYNDYEIPFLKFRKRLIFILKLLIIIEILFLIFLSTTSKSNYESKISNAVNREYYESFASYKHFNIEFEENNIASICVVEKFDGNFDIWFMATHDNSETIELANVFRNFNTHDSFSLYTPYDENMLISFDVYDNAANIPHKNFGVVAFLDVEKPFYLVVTDIYI